MREASSRIKSVAMEEMVHMCLACNILNALGTNPTLTVPTYPGPLPGGITGGGKEPLIIHLFPFSKDAMAQAMAIEEPEEGAIPFPHEMAPGCGRADLHDDRPVLRLTSTAILKTLPPSQLDEAGAIRSTIGQFLPGRGVCGQRL